MQYDGSGKLGEAIAALCECSPKSSALISNLIGQAKDGLGITSKSKKLPDDVKLRIWRWHYDRLNPVQDVKQDSSGQDSPVQLPHDATVQDVKQTKDDAPDLLPDNTVQNVKHDNTVYDIKQTNDNNMELLPDSTVQDVKQDAPVQLDEDMDNAVYDFKQVHFAVTVAARRTTVMLEGYLVKALQRKHGLIDNSSIRAWIEQTIKADGMRFDPDAALTRQVKRLIVESFMRASRG